MKKTRSAIRIPMPLRYLINLVLILALWFVLYTLIQNGTKAQGGRYGHYYRYGYHYGYGYGYHYGSDKNGGQK